MVAIKRLEEQNFIARIEQRHRRRVQPSRGARGDENLALRVVFQSVLADLFRRNGLPQPRNPVQPRVDVVPGAYRRDRPLRDRLRNRRIADALRQIDAADAIALQAHGANLRLHRLRREMAEGKAGSSRNVGHRMVSSITSVNGAVSRLLTAFWSTMI